MVKVAIWQSLRRDTGGRAVVEAEADNVGELLADLKRRYPGLRPQIERGVSVSVDGVLYSNSWLAEINPQSEVVLLPRLVGG